MSLPTPYYRDDAVTLYCGDALKLLPELRADAIVTDPPYEETTGLDWDRWPQGWPSLASAASRQLWCFGSLRLFMARASEFKAWKMSQDVVWEKHNGSSMHADRFRRLHEHVALFYQGEWSAMYKAPVMVPVARARSVQRKTKPAHWGDVGAHHYRREMGDSRLMGSVIYAQSCHGYATHPTEKPVSLLTPLLQYSVPPGGVVLDCFAGSGSTLAAACKTGRRAIGIEISEDYCAGIVSRMAQAEMAV